MTGAELRSTRERLRVTPQQVALHARVRTQEIGDWEASGVIPRKHRYDVDRALWEMECDAALEASGLPPCARIGAKEKALDGFDPDELVRHLDTCATCKARGEYLRANVRPEPIGGGAAARLFGAFFHLTGWKQAAFGGALFLVMMAGIGFPILLGMALLRRDPAVAGIAFAFLFLLIVSGAAGGLVHHFTAPLRSRGWIGYYASWILTVYGYLLAVFGLLSVGSVWFGPEFAEDLPILGEPSGWIILLIMGAVFGIALGRGAREDAAPPPQKSGVFTLRNAFSVVAGLFLLGSTLVAKWAGPSTPEEWEAALPALEEAARKEPGDPKAQRELAWAFVHLDRWDEAKPVLERAVRLNPNDADLHNSLGWARMQEGKHQEALPLLRRAVQLDPEHSYARHNLAWTLYMFEDYQEAEVLYREVLRQNPEHAGARAERGWVLLALFRPQEAEAEFQEALRRDRMDAWYHRGLAQAQMQQGRFAEAIATYREAVRIGPEDAVLWGDIGHVSHLQGAHVDAADAFARAERLDAGYFAANPYRNGMWDASRAGRMFVPPEE